MPDEKTPPEFDPEKTVVDLRRPAAKPSADESPEKTTALPRPPATSPVEDTEKTVVMTRPRSGGTPVSEEAEKTIVRGQAWPGSPGAAERTPAGTTPGAVASVSPSGYELVCLSGQARGRRFPLPQTEALVGSNPSCQVVLPGIEGVHAKLLRQGEEFELHNLGTPGSVSVTGGRKVAKAKVRSGDLLKVSDVVLRLVKSGEVFSSEYSDADFAPGLGRLVDPRFLRENPRYVLLGGLALLLLFGVLFWPSGSERGSTSGVVSTGPSASEMERQKQIESLLRTGEVLFKAGKLMAPPDRPEEENAFAKFNDVLALDPGNEQALAWLKRIDEEREKQRRLREEQEQRRLALERERQERERRALEERVRAIVAEGDALFEQGNVAEPAGRNALARYRDALKVDPASELAKGRVERAIAYYVERGDQFRERDDPWRALENYRKASRAAEGTDPQIDSRVREMETRLQAGMSSSTARLVLYKDDRGQLFVLDELEKVPARYRDRAVVVEPKAPIESR